MTQPDLNNLRQILDECERYAIAIRSDEQRAAVAGELLETVAQARAGLRPSPDSTANYIEVKNIIERLAALRERAERTA
jgi:hypothetical protein